MRWNSNQTIDNESKWEGASDDEKLHGGYDPDGGEERRTQQPRGRRALKEVPEPAAPYGYFLLAVAALIFVLLVIIGLYR